MPDGLNHLFHRPYGTVPYKIIKLLLLILEITVGTQINSTGLSTTIYT